MKEKKDWVNKIKSVKIQMPMKKIIVAKSLLYQHEKENNKG